MYASAQKFSNFKAYLTFLSTANTAKSMPQLSLFTLLRHISPPSTPNAILIAPSGTQSKASRAPQHIHRHPRLSETPASRTSLCPKSTQRLKHSATHSASPPIVQTPHNTLTVTQKRPPSAHSPPSLPQILLKLSLYPLHGIICGFLISAKNGGDFFYRHSRNV